MQWNCRTRFFLAALVLMPQPAVAAFPRVTDAERRMEEVENFPGAPAVVLFRRAELQMLNIQRGDRVSTLHVVERVKILTQAGLAQFGTVEIPHDSYVRLWNFEGRTVLPNGKIFPLRKDSILKEQVSQRQQRFVTKAIFSGVDVGAILDYRYTLSWGSIYYLRPWYFSQPKIPTLLSEITYHKPGNMKAVPAGRAPKAFPIQSSAKKLRDSLALTVWMENPPPIPEEPYSYPFEDLSSFFLLVPEEMSGVGRRPVIKLLDSWKTVCDAFEADLYKSVRRQAKQAKPRALEIAAAAGGSFRDQIEAVYSFVRDEIRPATNGWAIRPRKDMTADTVLVTGEGIPIEQAILLQAMLEALAVESRLVWAMDRHDGLFDFEIVNPAWFNDVLVRVDLDGEEVYLDPSDRRLGFGRLPPRLEGTPALLHDEEQPLQVTLPETPFHENRRRARLELALDGEGRIAGSGTLELAGHHAYQQIRQHDSEKKTADTWEQWLSDSLRGYEIGEVKTEESLATQEVWVSFTVAQRDEEVLGDEAVLVPSAPLGPSKQRFHLPPEKRLTPVLLRFADRNQVELELTWPEGWEIDLVPDPSGFATDAGAVAVDVEVDENERRLTFKRSFDITSRQFRGLARYAAIRKLYSHVEKVDARSIVLVRN